MALSEGAVRRVEQALDTAARLEDHLHDNYHHEAYREAAAELRRILDAWRADRADEERDRKASTIDGITPVTEMSLGALVDELGTFEPHLVGHDAFREMTRRTRDRPQPHPRQRLTLSGAGLQIGRTIQVSGFVHLNGRYRVAKRIKDGYLLERED